MNSKENCTNHKSFHWISPILWQVQVDLFLTPLGSGKFSIQLEQSTILPIGKDGKPIFKEDKNTTLPESLICLYDAISLNPGDKTTIPIHFVPLCMGRHICRLLFVDEKVGEFVYEVNASTGWPQVNEVL